MRQTKLLLFGLLLAITLVSCGKEEDESASINPVDGIMEVPLEGLTTEDGNYTFRLYTANGKFTKGYNEVFIALTDKNGQWVDNFSVSYLFPLMDMGMSKHSTPVGQVEKVPGKAFYQTWISFLMYSGQVANGAWSLAFDYNIAGATGHIAGVLLPVNNYPSTQAKWIQSFTGADSQPYYLTLVSPLLLKEGSNTIRAYINRQDEALQPYLPVADGFRIEIDPRMPSMANHTSTGNRALEWDNAQGLYVGTLNVSMTGYWRINLKVFDLAGNLIGGTDVTGSTDSSTFYWDIEL